LMMAAIRIPLLPQAPFLTYDPSDAVALLVGVIYGPATGAMVVFIKDILFLLFLAKGPFGPVADFIAAGTFVAVTAWAFRRGSGTPSLEAHRVDALRLDADGDPVLGVVGRRILVGAPMVPLREPVDVLGSALAVELHDLALDLDILVRVLAVEDRERHTTIGLHVPPLGPAGARVDENVAIGEPEPDGGRLHHARRRLGGEDGKVRLVKEGLHLGGDLGCHTLSSFASNDVPMI